MKVRKRDARDCDKGKAGGEREWRERRGEEERGEDRELREEERRGGGNWYSQNWCSDNLVKAKLRSCCTSPRYIPQLAPRVTWPSWPYSLHPKL